MPGSAASHQPTPPPSKRAGKVFGVTGLAIFTFSFLANVNTTPQLATFGLGSIVLFLGAIFLFLTPTAMASGEMGSTWPRTGGSSCGAPMRTPLGRTGSVAAGSGSPWSWASAGWCACWGSPSP